MVYRDGSDGLRGELREHLARRAVELSVLAPTFRGIYARRAARAAAGAVAAAGGVAVLAVALAAGVGRPMFGPNEAATGSLTLALGATWLCALATYALARVWAASRFDDELFAQLAPTGELHTDVERARRLGPREIGMALARRRERASVGLPLVALALLAPLSLHYLCLAVLDGRWPSGARFDGWIVLSAVIVGHCHLVLAIQAWLFARRLGERGGADVAGYAARAGWSAWTWTLAASAIPGLLLYGVPLFLVGVTGVFIPVAFASMGVRVRGERVQLSVAASM